VYDYEKEKVPAAFASEEAFLDAMRDTVLYAYEEITDDQWIADNHEMFVAPTWLPVGFKRYERPFAKDDPGIPGHTMYLRLWYDPETFELLTVTQSAALEEGRDREGPLAFSWKFEDGNPVDTWYPWVSHFAAYPIEKNGQFIYGYMLVRDGNRKAECVETLLSLSGYNE
jgi:hypothetical protein